jgi:CHAD domain-containing protein
LTVAKRNSLLGGLEGAAQDSTVRAVAASAALAAGGLVTARSAARNRAETRRRVERRYRLRGDEPIADGVRRIGRGQLELARELIADEHADAEAIHEARKTIKRLRALVRLSRDSLGTERYRAENAALRDVGRSLSGARDAEVLLQTLDRLVDQYARELPPGVWARFRKELETELQAAASATADATREAAAALSDAELRVSTWRLPEKGGLDALVPGMKRIYRRGRRALRRADDEPTAENLHELRKRAKDLWHASQLMRATSPKRTKRLGTRAHVLSDLLGDDHDLALLLERATAQPELFDAGELELLTALAHRRGSVLKRKALRCAKRVYRRKPARFLKKLSLG